MHCVFTTSLSIHNYYDQNISITARHTTKKLLHRSYVHDNDILGIVGGSVVREPSFKGSVEGVEVGGDVRGSTTLPLRHKSEEFVHSTLPSY